MLLTTKLLSVKDEKERSQYTIHWTNGLHVPPQLKNHEGPKTGGVLIILLVIRRKEETPQVLHNYRIVKHTDCILF